MDGLEKALALLKSGNDTTAPVSPLSLLVVTLVYSACVLSVPVYDPAMLLWYAIWPIAGSPWLGIPFARVFRRSLAILPFALLIGIFNPWLERETAFTAGGIAVSRGWLSFASVILRSLLAMQGVVMLISAHGFEGMCRSLRRLRVPAFLVTQLLFVYRYLTVLLEEALAMRRAREARGYGRKAFPMRLWGAFVGQLFLRTLARAERVHAAMKARGFRGAMPQAPAGCGWSRTDTVFLAASSTLFIAMRFVNLASIIRPAFS